MVLTIGDGILLAALCRTQTAASIYASDFPRIGQVPLSTPCFLIDSIEIFDRHE